MTEPTQGGDPFAPPTTPAPEGAAPPPPYGAPPPPPYGAPPPPGYGPPPAYGGPPTGAPGQYYGQYAPVVPPGMYYDPASGLVLPEGVALASVGRRIGAYFLAIPLMLVTLVIGYVIWGLIVWGRGQSPALQVLGMRCWRPETNRVASWGWMALRDIIGRIADGILSLISLLVSFILFVAGKEHKALHDHIAGTVVLHDPNKILG
jgi:uncharacterized RDD family membrane protein YckC